MKRNKIIKVLSFATVAILLLTMFALPISAEETAVQSPQILINPDFNPNTLLRAIINMIIGFIILVAAVAGGWNIVDGQRENDTKQRNGGIITIVVAFFVGALILIVVNAVLL